MVASMRKTDEQSALEQQRLNVTQEIGPWQVAMAWPRGADQGGPFWIDVRPNPSARPEDLAGGLSSTVLRKVDFRAAGEQWRALHDTSAEHRELVAGLGDDFGDVSHALRIGVADGLTDEYLALLAATYVAAVRLGRESVTQNLAEMVGRRPETIRAHLKAARAQGLLTSVKARAGGRLTEKAEEILRQMRESQKGEH